MVLKNDGDICKLGSQLRPALITPRSSTQRKNRKDKVSFKEHSVNLPSSPHIISPWKIGTPMDFWSSREKVSKQMFQYKPTRQKYPGDGNILAATNRATKKKVQMIHIDSLMGSLA
jgi:hypothetical protein